jgi:hypothetical protein
MSDKPTVTNREELDQTVDRTALLGSLALEHERPRSSRQHAEPRDGAESRGDDVDEWFARAALGRTCDDDEAPSRELLGAATLPLDGAIAGTPRPGRARVEAPGLACLWGTRGRARLLATFGALALAVVVVFVIGSVTSRPSTGATPPVVVTDDGASTGAVGDPVDRSLKVTTRRPKRHGAQRPSVAEADRRSANERRHRVQRQLLVQRRRQTARSPATTPAPVSDAPASAPARALASPRRPRQPRRSACGPFDLC